MSRDSKTVAEALALLLVGRQPDERQQRADQPTRIDSDVAAQLAYAEAEAELIQGRLELAGIPSALRRVASMDIPDYLAAGYREIHVPPAAAADARRLLAWAGETG